MRSRSSYAVTQQSDIYNGGETFFHCRVFSLSELTRWQHGHKCLSVVVNGCVVESCCHCKVSLDFVKAKELFNKTQFFFPPFFWPIILFPYGWKPVFIYK